MAAESRGTVRGVSVDAIPVGAVVIGGPDGAIREANRLAADKLLSASERVGASGDDSPLVGRLLSDLLESGDAVVTRLEASLRDSTRAVLTGVVIRRSDARPVIDVHACRAGPLGTVVLLIDADARSAAEAEAERLQRSLAESERLRTKMSVVKAELVESGELPRIIGSSAPVLRLTEQVRRVAPSSATVLIHGETGSGKELVARSVHALSPRAHEPFIAVNCAALPESLIESELFGHERGAFTGADRQRLGKFELADGGTLFLDEIAELSPGAQAKLLRVLQEGAIERVGGSETISVDVRVVAATHRVLAQQVERGRFREDLFYRLNVFRIDVPALRERPEDIKPLVEFLHERHARRQAREVLPLSERSLRRLLTYRWPGNVRELENAVERATLLAAGPELEIEIPEGPVTGAAGGSASTGGQATGAAGAGGGASRGTSSVPRDVLLDLDLEQLQRLQIMHALETRGYRVFGTDGAAAKLGINPQTLLSRMDKLGIPRPRLMRAALKSARREGA